MEENIKEYHNTITFAILSQFSLYEKNLQWLVRWLVFPGRYHNFVVILWIKRGHRGLDSDFPRKNRPYPEIPWIFSIFPIPNFPSRHLLEYFVYDWEPSLKQRQLSDSLTNCTMIKGLPGVLDPISSEKIVYLDIRN